MMCPLPLPPLCDIPRCAGREPVTSMGTLADPGAWAEGGGAYPARDGACEAAV